MANRLIRRPVTSSTPLLPLLLLWLLATGAAMTVLVMTLRGVTRGARPSFSPQLRSGVSRSSAFASSTAGSTAGSTTGSKRVFFIRHGQAEHNVFFESGRKEEGRKIIDPGLTKLGFEQAKSVAREPMLTELLQRDSTENEKPLIVVSPLRRTLQTALAAFQPFVDTQAQRGKPVEFVCNADIQETGEINCDCGSPLNRLTEEFSDFSFIDFSDLSEDWHEKKGDYRDQGQLLLKRFNRFKKWVSERPEKTVIVVGHHNIFLANLGISFKNCEVREYVADGDNWTPVFPLVSSHDDELSEEDRKHIGIYGGHAKWKMETWGIPAPARFR